MAAGDHAALIETCVRLGDAAAGGDAQLWTQALRHFGSQQTDCTPQARCKSNPDSEQAPREYLKTHLLSLTNALYHPSGFEMMPAPCVGS
jgi:hypothetical protein